MCAAMHMSHCVNYLVFIQFTEEFKGGVKLDKLKYNKITYGDPKSYVYKTVAADFCSKVGIIMQQLLL